MRRRAFIKSAGCFVASAGVTSLAGCTNNDLSFKPGGAGEAAFSFPQGVASADPRADSVLLWTRVEAHEPAGGPVRLWAEVSLSDSFQSLVLDKELEVDARSDHTVRLLVEGLEPATTYYYRFRAGQEVSRLGRTRTAPAPDANTPLRLAWVSCQDYSAGFYGAYRRLVNDDEKRPEAEQVAFVLHLGDFIYETRAEGFQTAVDEHLKPVELVDETGRRREVPPFPGGGGRRPGARFAQTVDDYRHLYRTVLSDPDLQEARARWPFVCVWDDHEFSNDAWQTQANYTNDKSTDEPSQRRKVAANQAWFEYVPAVLSDLGDAARDFVFTEVEDAPYDQAGPDNYVTEANNQAALDTIRIYRTLRFGRHLQLVLSDVRSYRSDHALPEETSASNPLLFNARVAVPLEIVAALDAGKTANGGMPPERVGAVDNPRRSSPAGTILGSAQKQWWKQTMKQSTATWKLWANPIPLLRLRLDASDVPLVSNLVGDLLISADAWDGYPSERRELMSYLLAEGIGNVVSLSGDHHGHFAGIIYDDFDAAAPAPVLAEFATAGVASNSLFSAVAGGSVVPDQEAIRRVITYDSRPLGGKPANVPNLNTLLRYGSRAANVAANTHDLAQVEAARKMDVNPHLRFVDTHARGYGVIAVEETEVKATLVTIEPPIVDRGEEGARLRGSADFTLKASAAGKVALDEPMLDGVKPFPLA